MTVRRLALAAATALAGTALVTPAASAHIVVPTVAACTKGATMSLAASHGYGGTINVSVSVSGSRSGHVWLVGASDNLTGIYGGHKRAGSTGSFAVHTATANQAGVDNLAASAVNIFTGEVCVATLAVTD